MRRKCAKWFDEWKMAGEGVLLASRNWKFWLVFAISMVVFGCLMVALSGSAAASLNLLWSVGWADKFKIIGNLLLMFFGKDQNFWDWLLIFGITFVQSVLIALVALVWRKKQKNAKRTKTKSDDFVANVENADNLQSAGLVAGLAVLGTGCPSCGTALLTPILAPVLATFLNTGSYAVVGVISGLLTLASFLVAIFALKRIGRDAYATILSERFNKNREEKDGRE